MSAENGEGDRPSREVAYRLFAAEFDDASFSYSESDEERAPNYVVTPTGARVNRLFAVGVLTEVEAVNDDVLRGRIVDPTGAFVSYAGQYQPDDSDQVFTSVRPESMSRVDADTRDRWTVSAAEATLERIGVMAAAIQSGLTGEALREALSSAGVDQSLAAGVPLAVDHYGTTPAYLAALRDRAVQTLEVVADERDSVDPMTLAPSGTGTGEASAAALAADLDLATHAVEAPEPTTETPAAGETGSPEAAGAEASAASDADVDSAVGVDDGDAESEPATAGTAATADSATVDARTGTDDVVDATDSTATGPGDGDDVSTVSEATGTSAGADESAVDASTGESTADTATAAGESTTDGTEEEPAVGAGTADDLGDFDSDDASASTASQSTASTPDDELGDFDTGDGAAEASAEPTDTGGTDADGMYELDEEERAEVEAEFGTEFSTGSEVAPAGEADIDVPSAEEVEDELEDETGDASGTTSDREPEPTREAETDSASDDSEAGETADTSEAGETADTSETDDSDTAAGVDLEAAAVEAMAALDDGDGASREAVVGHVVDEYGVDPADVEDAIQSALMSGQCYEPTEDSLKAI